MGDSAEEIARDVAMVGQIDSVPTILRVLCEITGMGFAAVARVSDGTWTACAVLDEISFGLLPGGQLDVNTTLCKEVRFARAPVVISQASTDDTYCDHHTPRIYSIESYVSVPIVLAGDVYFGNLCAIDPRPAAVSEPRILAMFTHFAALIASQLENERRRATVQSALLDERTTAELREQLIAVLGSELRHPISSIALSSQLLKGKSHDPTAVEAIATQIAADVRRASALIDNTLDFARGKLGGEIALRIETIERIDEALFGVITEQQAAHPGRNVEWKFDVHHPVRVDRSRIQQVASSLITNAIANSAPSALVRLVAKTTGDALVMTVWNDGEPIAPDRIATIFAPVWRGETSGKREGISLGLHICAQIVKAHGGTITVISTATGGTLFTVTLPL